MKKYLPTVISVIVILTLSILSLVFSDLHLSQNQSETMIILLIICGTSMLYCFVVGELTHNYSQMDKLWSLLPIAYSWVICAKGGFDLRLIVYAVIATIWGIRLTINFGRKGAYTWKFWQGEEDYRWKIVHGSKFFKKNIAWSMFNLFFISIYQNAIVLAITFPALAVMDSPAAFGVWDFVAAGLALCFVLIETIADEEQWKFHETKKSLLKEGRTLEELEDPYNLGFNTVGLWGRMRHPNYLGEQGIWISLYIMTIGAGVAVNGIFHWSIIGPLFLILLFSGSSTLAESISSSKYPLYQDYIGQVYKYIPLRHYKVEKSEE